MLRPLLELLRTLQFRNGTKRMARRAPHRKEDSYSFIRRHWRQLHSAEVAIGVCFGFAVTSSCVIQGFIATERPVSGHTAR
jgi:hypothetical protein